jgi:hypothetical protein
MNYQSRPPAARIRPYLSAERLARYQLATGGDPEKALRLYEWNAQVGAAFLEILGHLEIVLRNALDRQLQTWHDAQGLPGRWYDDPLGVFDPHRREDVSAARQRLQRDGKSETPGRIIAELSFGFWRFLLVGTTRTASGPTRFPDSSRSAAPMCTTSWTHIAGCGTGSRTTSPSISWTWPGTTRMSSASPATSTPTSGRGLRA